MTPPKKRNKKMKPLGAYSREDLLALPRQERTDGYSDFEFLIVFPTGEQHESSYGCMGVVGCRGHQPVALLGTSCDDLQSGWGSGPWALRIDCLWPSLFFRIWSNSHRLRIGPVLSSSSFHQGEEKSLHTQALAEMERPVSAAAAIQLVPKERL